MKTIKPILYLAIILLAGSGQLVSQSIQWTQKANPNRQQVNSLAFRSDGLKILSGTNCHPAFIRMFDVPTSNIDWSFNLGSELMCVMGVAFSANSDYIAAVEEFGNVLVFDNTGVQPVITDTIQTATSFAFSLAISPGSDRLAVGCSNGRLKVYQLPGGAIERNINAHPLAFVTRVVYSLDGSKIITGGSDHRIRIWNSQGLQLSTLTGHTSWVTSLKIAPDSSTLISASGDGTIKKWNLDTGVLLQTIPAHQAYIYDMDLSPDGTMAVSVASDSTIRLWSLTQGSLIASFGISDSGEITSVAWSPAGNYIVTGNASSDVTLWNISALISTEERQSPKDFKVRIYPNPAAEYILLDISEESVPDEVSIFDITGGVYFTSNHLPDKIPVYQLASGSYFICLSFGNLKVIKPFSKL